MMSDFMHEHIAQIKSSKRLQSRPSKRISMKKHAGVPVVAVKRGRPSITFQLLYRTRQYKDSAQPSQKIGGATFQFGLDLLRRARLDESFKRLQLDHFWEHRLFGDPSVETFKHPLNLQPPRFIFSPVREAVF